MSTDLFGLGTFVSNASNYMGTGHSVRQQEREEQETDYLRRERLGIQSRIEGAKAAGIHPLVAMGFQAGPGPTTVLGGVREASQSARFGDDEPAPQTAPAAETTSEDQDRINKANVRIAEANADQAELATHEAYRKLATQPGQAIPVVESATTPLPTYGGNLRSGVKLKPDEVTASRASAGLGAALTAGIHPGSTDFRLPIGKHGRTVRLPSGKLAESLEDLDALKLLITAQMNMGMGWDAIKNDIPWAFRGALQDLRKAVGLPPVKQRRGRGATGSW